MHLLRGKGLQSLDHFIFRPAALHRWPPSGSRMSPCSSRVNIRGAAMLISHGLVSINGSERVSIAAYLRMVSINEEMVSIDAARFSLWIVRLS